MTHDFVLMTVSKDRLFTVSILCYVLVLCQSFAADCVSVRGQTFFNLLCATKHRSDVKELFDFTRLLQLVLLNVGAVSSLVVFPCDCTWRISVIVLRHPVAAAWRDFICSSFKNYPSYQSIIYLLSITLSSFLSCFFISPVSSANKPVN